ncbi:MAG TPA: BON domain-containing protein [Chroococcales cyanobacterium]
MNENMKKLLVFGISTLVVGSAALAADDAAKDQAKFEKSQKTAPTNTAKNQRDEKLGKATPEDQGESAADLKLAARLRRSIMHQKDLSPDGQNVKIIANNGCVTLRGPVDSEKEKQLIGDLAKGCFGADKTTNELEVKSESK